MTMGWWPSARTEDSSSTASSTSATAPAGSSNPASGPAPQESAQTSRKGDSLFEEISEGLSPDSTETNLRYAAYTNRIRTVLTSAHRYVAYTSEIGESFRPVAHPKIVRTAYGISWAYILGDVSYEGYKAYLQNEKKRFPVTQSQPWRDGTSLDSSFSPVDIPPLEDYRTVMVQRGVFQSLASMGLPAFTIHSVVKYSGKAMKGIKNQRVRTWGPVGLGLGIVPFLPAIFDEPVENAVEWVFHRGFKWYGGEGYIGDAPATGREHALGKKVQKERDL